MNTKHRLLIVDGNPYVAGILVQNLAADFAVTVAASGQEAARLLVQGNRFDCVLTELDLPLFSGLDLTQLIRTSRLINQTPIVVLSSAADSETRITCLERGVDSYIAKPFNPLEVKAKLQALLRRTTVATEETRQPAAPVRSRIAGKPLGSIRARVLSMILRGYTVTESA